LSTPPTAPITRCRSVTSDCVHPICAVQVALPRHRSWLNRCFRTPPLAAACAAARVDSHQRPAIALLERRLPRRVGQAVFARAGRQLAALPPWAGRGAAAVASFLAAALTEIYLRNVCSCQEILRRNVRTQAFSYARDYPALPPRMHANYGSPLHSAPSLGPGAGGPLSVFTREWTRATVTLDCHTFRAEVTPQARAPTPPRPARASNAT
jgi:hypothetical protein